MGLNIFFIVFGQETETEAFERKKREREEQAEAKTSKNRAKRQKKKEKAKGKGPEKEGAASASAVRDADVPLKKRRLVNGQELVFRKPGEDSEDDEYQQQDIGPAPPIHHDSGENVSDEIAVPIVDATRITIHEDD